MRKLVLAAVLVLVAGAAQASLYLQIGGNVVDPILTTSGAVHPYSGPNLQPAAYLLAANLSNAYLSNANLSNANLYGAYLGDRTFRCDQALLVDWDWRNCDDSMKFRLLSRRCETCPAKGEPA